MELIRKLSQDVNDLIIKGIINNNQISLISYLPNFEEIAPKVPVAQKIVDKIISFDEALKLRDIVRAGNDLRSLSRIISAISLFQLEPKQLNAVTRDVNFQSNTVADVRSPLRYNQLAKIKLHFINNKVCHSDLVEKFHQEGYFNDYRAIKLLTDFIERDQLNGTDKKHFYQFLESHLLKFNRVFLSLLRFSQYTNPEFIPYRLVFLHLLNAPEVNEIASSIIRNHIYSGYKQENSFYIALKILADNPTNESLLLEISDNLNNYEQLIQAALYYALGKINTPNAKEWLWELFLQSSSKEKNREAIYDGLYQADLTLEKGVVIPYVQNRFNEFKQFVQRNNQNFNPKQYQSFMADFSLLCCIHDKSTHTLIKDLLFYLGKHTIIADDRDIYKYKMRHHYIPTLLPTYFALNHELGGQLLLEFYHSSEITELAKIVWANDAFTILHKALGGKVTYDVLSPYLACLHFAFETYLVEKKIIVKALSVYEFEYYHPRLLEQLDSEWYRLLMHLFLANQVLTMEDAVRWALKRNGKTDVKLKKYDQNFNQFIHYIPLEVDGMADVLYQYLTGNPQLLTEDGFIRATTPMVRYRREDYKIHQKILSMNSGDPKKQKMIGALLTQLEFVLATIKITPEFVNELGRINQWFTQHLNVLTKFKKLGNSVPLELKVFYQNLLIQIDNYHAQIDIYNQDAKLTKSALFSKIEISEFLQLKTKIAYLLS